MSYIGQAAAPYLYHIKDNKAELYVSFVDNTFSGNTRITNIMDRLGVDIPPSQVTLYSGKRKVYPTDGALFEKAFREIYFPLHMPKNEYEWKSDQQI